MLFPFSWPVLEEPRTLRDLQTTRSERLAMMSGIGIGFWQAGNVFSVMANQDHLAGTVVQSLNTAFGLHPYYDKWIQRRWSDGLDQSKPSIRTTSCLTPSTHTIALRLLQHGFSPTICGKIECPGNCDRQFAVERPGTQGHYRQIFCLGRQGWWGFRNYNQ